MADNSKIILGLPNLPPEQIDPKLWSEFLTIYRAIQNLLLGVSQYTGIDPPSDAERATMDPSTYLLGTNVERYYPLAATNISRGQIVRLRPDIGAHWVSPAFATGPTGVAFGVANETKAPGQNIEIIAGLGLTDAISGMIPGTLYYLSTTVGAIQNLRPLNPGEIIQPVGYALTSNQMLLRISSYYQQL